MKSHRILQLNAASTAACGLVMLATRRFLPSFFGLETPLLLDVTAIAFLAYAGALAVVAQRQPVSRGALMTFTAADAAWVVASAVLLIAFWTQLTSVGRFLVIAVALVVEVFATLQFRAARRVTGPAQVA
jgi:hypothetical protein